jgi:hypothetical protein
MAHTHSPFADPAMAASYAENARRNVPGLADLHRMVRLLLATAFRPYPRGRGRRRHGDSGHGAVAA